MPVVFRFEGYRFFFFSNKGSEPVHIHVRKAERAAKFWIDPVISLAESYGMTSSELRKLMRVVTEREVEIRSAWHEYFGE
ncbi:MAG: DUF4160 domain-containing protein [Planctomycetes bacterium]|nr:DUF4160 domain-containing protein [Planctomycetota bacterium]